MKETENPIIYFEEDEDIINICYDNVFKAVFARDTQNSQIALANFISTLIYREITVVTIIANEPSIDNLKDRQIRYDINCRADTGEFINVEMSLNPDKDEPARLEFYAAKLLTGQDIKGTEKGYDDLKQTYQIAILVNGRFFSDKEFFHNFRHYDPDRGISLNGKSRIITLELSKLKDIIKKPVDKMSPQERWAIYFKYLTDKTKRSKINRILEIEGGIAMASEILKSISKDEKERWRLMSEEKYQLDMQNELVYAKREGIAEGIAEGIEQGIEQGQDYVLKLMAQGFTYEEIKKKIEEMKQR